MLYDHLGRELTRVRPIGFGASSRYVLTSSLDESKLADAVGYRFVFPDEDEEGIEK